MGLTVKSANSSSMFSDSDQNKNHLEPHRTQGATNY